MYENSHQHNDKLKDILIFMKASGDGNKVKSLLESKVKEVPDSHPFITLLDSVGDIHSRSNKFPFILKIL